MARRNISPGEKAKWGRNYAYCIAPDGHVRSIPLRAGCTHRVVHYDGNSGGASKSLDRGRFAWYIREKARQEGWMKVIEGYEQDSRPEMSRRESNGKPAGYNAYMEYVGKAEAGLQGREAKEFERDDGRKYKRTVPRAFPLMGLPEICIKRIKGIRDDLWKPADYPVPDFMKDEDEQTQLAADSGGHGAREAQKPAQGKGRRR